MINLADSTLAYPHYRKFKLGVWNIVYRYCDPKLLNELDHDISISFPLVETRDTIFPSIINSVEYSILIKL